MITIAKVGRQLKKKRSKHLTYIGFQSVDEFQACNGRWQDLSCSRSQTACRFQHEHNIVHLQRYLSSSPPTVLSSFLRLNTSNTFIGRVEISVRKTYKVIMKPLLFVYLYFLFHYFFYNISLYETLHTYYIFLQLRYILQRRNI